jgi:hypothetical protein
MQLLRRGHYYWSQPQRRLPLEQVTHLKFDTHVKLHTCISTYVKQLTTFLKHFTTYVKRLTTIWSIFNAYLEHFTTYVDHLNIVCFLFLHFFNHVNHICWSFEHAPLCVSSIELIKVVIILVCVCTH